MRAALASSLTRREQAWSADGRLGLLRRLSEEGRRKASLAVAAVVALVGLVLIPAS